MTIAFPARPSPSHPAAGPSWPRATASRTSVPELRSTRATLAFAKGVFVSSAVPSTTYEKLARRQSPALYLGLLGTSTGVLVLAAPAYPVTALVRWQRGRSVHPRAARAARSTASATGLIAAAFTAALGAAVRDGNAMMEMVPLGAPLLSTIMMLGTALVALTPGVVAWAIAAWLRSWWSVTGCILFTVTAVAAVTMTSMLLKYHLVGCPFAWPAQ
ncbi:hypothetical protein OHA91_38225 [Streptomyces erythrochromogenes]|uniref:Uncharacterized protein n=1 Tax=Streptomyces erythrochromogenes TaxID=285574 RepID=A0ABZ1QMZ5_9ACTN|nr:hypothetical protein [Streptomyces erythrochromogenes]